MVDKKASIKIIEQVLLGVAYDKITITDIKVKEDRKGNKKLKITTIRNEECDGKTKKF